MSAIKIDKMNDRPKLKIPLETHDLILEITNITLLVGIWLYVISNYSNLPETIPTHFNAKGEPDDTGSKILLWILPIISLVTFGLIYFISKKPHIHNYMVNINEENAFKNYKLSSRFLRYTNLFCLFLFSAIVYQTVELAKGHNPNILGTPFLIFTLVFPFIGIAIIFYYQKKINS